MQSPSLVGSLMDPNQLAQALDQSEQFKKCLAKLSVRPRYQYLLIGFMSLMWLVIAFNTMIGSFVFMNPLFKCNGEAKTQKQACKTISQCVITNDFTAVIHMRLFCEKEEVRATIQSFFAIGCVAGMLCLPIISDGIGRRRASIMAFLIGIAAISIILVGIKQNIESLVMVGMLLAGIYGAGFTILGFVMTCDFCEEKLRQKCLMFYCAMWGLGEMIFYLLYNYMPDWDKYLVFMLLIPTSVFFIFILFFLIQSPVFAVFAKKSPTIFKEAVRKLSAYNKVQPHIQQQAVSQGLQIIKKLRQQMDSRNSARNKSQLKQSLKRIVWNKKNLIVIVGLTVPNMAFNFYYYGMQGSMERTGYSFGVNMLLVGLHEFLAYLSASYVTKYIRRKRGLIVSVIITSSIGLLFLLPFIKEREVLQSILVSASRVTSVYAYSFILLLESQLLHIQIRSVGYALIDGIGQSGRIVVPYIINWMNNMGMQTLVLSSLIFLFAGTLPVLFLSEPLNLNKADKQQRININQHKDNQIDYNQNSDGDTITERK